MSVQAGPGFLASLNLSNFATGMVNIGTVSTAWTFDLTGGIVQKATLTVSTACAFAMPPPVAGAHFTAIIKQAPGGNGTATFTGVKWTGSAPTITATGGKVDIFRFGSDGIDWFGVVEGQGYSPTVTGTHITDNFNRADNSTLGSSWTARNSTLGIIGNTAYATDTSGGVCAATHNTPLTADDMTVSWTVGAYTGSGPENVVLFLGANTSGESVAGFWFGAAAYIFTTTNWPVTGATARAASSAAYSPGDVLAIQRVGNVYQALKNGAAYPPSVTWTDVSNVVPRDSSHRLAGIGLVNNAGAYRAMDAFAADSA